MVSTQEAAANNSPAMQTEAGEGTPIPNMGVDKPTTALDARQEEAALPENWESIAPLLATGGAVDAEANPSDTPSKDDVPCSLLEAMTVSNTPRTPSHSSEEDLARSTDARCSSNESLDDNHDAELSECNSNGSPDEGLYEPESSDAELGRHFADVQVYKEFSRINLYVWSWISLLENMESFAREPTFLTYNFHQIFGKIIGEAFELIDRGSVSRAMEHMKAQSGGREQEYSNQVLFLLRNLHNEIGVTLASMRDCRQEPGLQITTSDITSIIFNIFKE